MSIIAEVAPKSNPLLTFALTPAEREALLLTWDLGIIGQLHPEIRHYPCRLRAGQVEVYRPRPGRLDRGKQVIRKGKDESAWAGLMRLGAQAAINGCEVRPLDESLTRFACTSQEPDAAGDRDSYLVKIFQEVTVCTCPRGEFHPGAPCGHVGAVYLWLRAELAELRAARARAASAAVRDAA